MILIAEDDPDDQYLLQVVLSPMGDSCEFHFVQDGEELMDYVHQRGEYAKSKPRKPGLILLDLSMPRKNGWQALAEMKKNDQLKSIPIVVWTTSKTEEDMQSCKEAGADDYVTKPDTFSDLEAAIKNIVKTWLQLIPERAR